MYKAVFLLLSLLACIACAVTMETTGENILNSFINRKSDRLICWTLEYCNRDDNYLLVAEELKNMDLNVTVYNDNNCGKFIDTLASRDLASVKFGSFSLVKLDKEQSGARIFLCKNDVLKE